MSIQRNKEAMKRFETMINACDDALAEELVNPDASFITPASSEPVHGPQGYLGIVRFMRQGFPDVQWKLEEMVAEGERCRDSGRTRCVHCHRLQL